MQFVKRSHTFYCRPPQRLGVRNQQAISRSQLFSSLVAQLPFKRSSSESVRASVCTALKLEYPWLRNEGKIMFECKCLTCYPEPSESQDNVICFLRKIKDCLCFPGGSVVKNLLANAGDMGSIPGWGRFPGEENGNPLQYACLGNPIRGSWWSTVHGVAKNQTQSCLSSN